jgi:hypothetical protein
VFAANLLLKIAFCSGAEGAEIEWVVAEARITLVARINLLEAIAMVSFGDIAYAETAGHNLERDYSVKFNCLELVKVADLPCCNHWRFSD